jgi:hypothetical protein
MPLDAPRPSTPLAPNSASSPPGRSASASSTAAPRGSCKPSCPRPDNPSRTLTGSAAGLTADAAFAELSSGDLPAERRARDAESQGRKRAGARLSLGYYGKIRRGVLPGLYVFLTRYAWGRS